MSERCRPRLKMLSEYEEIASTWNTILAGGIQADLELLQERVPRFLDQSLDDIATEELSREETLNLVALEHGYELWSEFRTIAVAIERESRREAMVEACQAVDSCDASALLAILDEEPDLVKTPGTGGETLLHRAMWGLDHGDWSWLPGPRDDPARIELVELVLAKGANPHCANHRGWTPLHTAAYIGHVPAVERLLALGCDRNAETQGKGGTPLVLALFWGHRETAELLRGDLCNLRVAAGLGDLAMLNSLAESGAGFAEVRETSEFYRPHEGFPRWDRGYSRQEVLDDALVYACRNDRASIVSRLGELGADPNGRVAGTTPLIVAACHGSNRVLRWLLDNGSDVDQTGDMGASPDATALHLAAWYGHRDTVELLVEREARYDLRDSKWDGTAVSWAKIHGNDDIAELLVGRGALDMRDAISNGLRQRVLTLLERAPRTATDSDRDGNTPLHYAAYADEVDIVKLLLAHGASADTRNNDGATARDAAQEAQSTGTLQLFEENS